MSRVHTKVCRAPTMCLVHCCDLWAWLLPARDSQSKRYPLKIDKCRDGNPQCQEVSPLNCIRKSCFRRVWDGKSIFPDLLQLRGGGHSGRGQRKQYIMLGKGYLKVAGLDPSLFSSRTLLLSRDNLRFFRAIQVTAPCREVLEALKFSHPSHPKNLVQCGTFLALVQEL